MKSFLLALQFLTRIPVKIRNFDSAAIGRSSIYFPAIGALLGLILAGADYALGFLGCDNLSASAVEIVLLIILTGALHLDGVADTCDALLSGKNKEEMLAIMRDPHAGAMGVTGVVSVILLKVAFLSSLFGSVRIAALVLMCAFGRWAMVCSMATAPYARSDGKAKALLDGVNLRTTLIAGGLAAAIAAIAWQFTGLILFAVTTGVTVAITVFMKRRFGGITGDTLGATNESIEILTLFLICIGQAR